MSGESAGDPALIHRTIAGKFRVEKFLGGGAMGAVYRAHQSGLDRKVALKVMHRSLATDEAFTKRFKREAKAASKLDHPNSMRIIDYGEEPDGLLYIAMEYLEGRDLFRVIHEDWPLPNERIADVLMQALAAIAVAHDEGVIHRDLKPENIMVLRGKNDEGRDCDTVKVCDFGIAKITESDEPASTADPGNPAARKLTTQGLVVGTPEYMSPEQARGEKLDARSDLYSVGIILYQLLTGRTPFVADSPLAVVLKHLNEAPKPPVEIFAGVHKGLEAVCLRAIAKDREHRYQSAREMRSAIRAAIEGRPLPDIASAATEKLAAASAPPPPQAVTSVAPAAPPPAMPASSKVTPLGTEAASAGRRRSGFAMPVVLGIVFLGLGAGGVVVYSAKHKPAAPVAEPARSSEPAPVVSTPSAEPPKLAAPEPTPSASPVSASAEPKAKEAPRSKEREAKAKEKHAAEPAALPPTEPEPQPQPQPQPPPQAQPQPPSPPPQAPAPAPFDGKKCKLAASTAKRSEASHAALLQGAWRGCPASLPEKPASAPSARVTYDEEGRVKVSCPSCAGAFKSCIEGAKTKFSASGTNGDFEVSLGLSCD